MSDNGHKKLRLVKVIVQPVLVLDDGENLQEQTVEPIQVAAENWNDYPAKMAEEIKRTEAELNGDS